MAADNASVLGQFARLLEACLAQGRRVDVDGLGSFVPRRGGLRFLAERRPRVFVAYVQEDAAVVERLCDALAAAGLAPWIDRRQLLPGQNWPRAIEAAIETCDFFLACFSSRSVRKKGGFQAEIRYALDCARRVPLDDVFLIPVRLDACRIPRLIRREWQYVDLFPDRGRGVRRVIAAIRRQMRRKPRPGCRLETGHPAT